MSSSEPSVFELIVAREIPADIVFENDRLIAFRDIAPKAPLHLLVVPKSAEYRDVTELAGGDPGLLAELVITAADLAAEHSNGDYRLVFNTGASAGQTVFHVHAHVLSGALDESSLADQ
jgi:histidine triad (HIT) family protein